MERASYAIIRQCTRDLVSEAHIQIAVEIINGDGNELLACPPFAFQEIKVRMVFHDAL